MKHEWRKKEKHFYIPKAKPEVVDIPEFTFVTLSGSGNPNSAFFSDCIQALYTMSYTIKMTLKKIDEVPLGYHDYTVYPLEGVWDINDEAKKIVNYQLDKNHLVFKLMIRQPNFIGEEFFNKMREASLKKKELPLLKHLKLEKLIEGHSIQMMHIGSYDDEPKTFEIMEQYAASVDLKRCSKVHREIYLSDFRKVAPDKLKTVLRFSVKGKNEID